MKSLAQQTRDAVLERIACAQAQLNLAASLACDLRGWSDQWHDIGDTADAIKALWHRCDNAPMPTSHASEGRPVFRRTRSLEDNPKLTDR